MTLTRSQAKSITGAALKAAKTELSVSVSAARGGYLRFSQNQAAATGETERLDISITSTIDGRSATVSGTRRDPAAIAALVQQAEAMARLAPVDPEHVPPLGPQTYVDVDARDPKTAALAGEQRSELAAAMIRAANKAKLEAAGMIEHSDRAHALANSAGLFAFHAAADVEASMTCRTRDGTGSGWAGALSQRTEDLGIVALAARAAEKAELSREPEALKPGPHVVILEPMAVAELLTFLLYGLSRRAADEGRSFFSKPGGGTKLGATLFHPSITLRSDPADPRAPSRPYAGDGQALAPTTWIDKGALRALECPRYWAQKQGVAAVPMPSSFLLDGSERPLDELIRGVDRGVLVTRFWYNRMVEPRTILATGLTRDGTFLIEQGKIARAAKNMRYNESPVTMLQSVLAVGKAERVPMGGRVIVVPPLVVAGFNFASLSDAV